MRFTTVLNTVAGEFETPRSVKIHDWRVGLVDRILKIVVLGFLGCVRVCVFTSVFA